MEHAPQAHDTDLILRAQNGDTIAFDRIVETYIDRVFSYVLVLTHDHTLSEDITQLAFIRTWNSRKTIDPHRSILPWLLRIAKHAVIDDARRKKSTPFSSFENDAHENVLLETVADDAPLPDAIFEHHERKELVTSLLRELPQLDQEILHLYYFDELRMEEIAELLDTPKNTLKSRHQRALKKLRLLLREKVVDAPKTSDSSYTSYGRPLP